MTDRLAPTAGRLRPAQPFRQFDVRVERTVRLGPSFVRVTFGGEDLDRFSDNGFDQRIKLFLPVPGRGHTAPPSGADWYGLWRGLPDAERHPIRTYTVRAVRPAERELDVDMLLHADGGPAARWLAAARAGDRLTVLGPDASYPGHHGGVDFVPPVRTGCLLLAGDETAVPAIASILERLPAGSRGEALLEVPDSADATALRSPPGMVVRWLGRDGADHGQKLIPAVRAAADRLLAGSGGHACTGSCAAAHPLEDVDVDSGLLWEVPVDSSGAPLAACLDLYCWLAGEAGVIKALRRHLVSERGLDRSAVAFMGYWRRGRAETS